MPSFSGFTFDPPSTHNFVGRVYAFAVASAISPHWLTSDIVHVSFDIKKTILGTRRAKELGVTRPGDVFTLRFREYETDVDGNVVRGEEGPGLDFEVHEISDRYGESHCQLAIDSVKQYFKVPPMISTSDKAMVITLLSILQGCSTLP